MLGSLIGGGMNILGGLFGPGKEIKRLMKDIRTKYLPEYTRRQYGAADTMGANLQAEGGSLLPFYDEYMRKGSPILGQLLAAGGERSAQEFQNQSQMLNQKLAQTGYGFTPSGLFAGAQGDLARASAGSSRQAYMDQLMKNELLKFQAASGKRGVYQDITGGYGEIGKMFDPSALFGIASRGGGTTDWSKIGGGIKDILGSFLKKGGGGGSTATYSPASLWRDPFTGLGAGQT